MIDISKEAEFKVIFKEDEPQLQVSYKGEVLKCMSISSVTIEEDKKREIDKKEALQKAKKLIEDFEIEPGEINKDWDLDS